MRHLRSTPNRALFAALAIACAAGAMARATAQATVPVDITVRGPGGEQVAANVFLKDADGKPVRPPGLPFWYDHFTCNGRADLDLPPGEYRYEVERGPEWERAAGSFRAGERPVRLIVRMRRLCDLTLDGWRSGETHVHRPVGEADLLLEASDLDHAQVITWWNRRNLWEGRALPPDPTPVTSGGRSYSIMAGEDEREGGALLFFRLPRPLAIQEAARDYPSSVRFLRQAARQAESWIDAEKPFWWDLPLWLASGRVDTIGIVHNHMHRSGVMDAEAWGRPRPAAAYPGPHGNGHWTQEIYYRVLSAGLRIPPSAGSASGVLPNPVGYNRVYGWTGPNGGFDDWCRAVRAGRSFVTNGPLLEVTADGKLPGEVFRTGAESLDLPLRVRLRGRDRIARVEIIQDGRPVLSVRGWADDGWRDLERLRISRSGWFLVRAIATEERTFRFASTAPFYVEFIGRPAPPDPISRRFFLDWLEERRKRLQITDAAQRAEVEGLFDAAGRFWRGEGPTG